MSKVGVNWGWCCACSGRRGIDSESRETVADDNSRASDNLATQDYPSLCPGPGWRISCS